MIPLNVRPLPGQTLHEIWIDPGNYNPAWLPRAEMALKLLGSARWVCDMGCGLQGLRALLPRKAIYLPADLRQWAPDTAVCELNDRRYPITYLKACDVCFMLGVLEYIWKIDRLFIDLAKWAEVLVFSYHVAELTPENRPGVWVNLLSSTELSNLLAHAGYKIDTTLLAPGETQILFRAGNRNFGFRRGLKRMGARANVRIR